MPAQPLGPTGLLTQSMTLPAGSQSMAMGGMRMQAQGMDGRKKGVGLAGRYLIVGGGAGGGRGESSAAHGGPGGGGGGVIFISAPLLSGRYEIKVGSGGPGAVAFTTPMVDTSGGNSSLGEITAIGGAAVYRPDGQDTFADSPAGGSGSGGYFLNFGGLPVDARYGNKGGDGVGSGSGGAGGGGAGSAGAKASSVLGANGGSSRIIDITGTPQSYGGGGAGGGAVGAGGGSAGTNAGNGGSSGGAGATAVANFGGGGGGGGAGSSGVNGRGGDGGSGIVIWSYASPIQLCTGGTVTNYLDGSTRWWVHTFTSNGTLVVP